MKKYAIEMGGVSRYFSKVSGSGVDLTLLTGSEMWVRPQLPFGRPPPSPPLQLKDLFLKPQPFPPHRLSASSTHHSDSFCNAPGGGGTDWCGGGVLGPGGAEGGGPLPAALAQGNRIQKPPQACKSGKV